MIRANSSIYIRLEYGKWVRVSGITAVLKVAGSCGWGVVNFDPLITRSVKFIDRPIDRIEIHAENSSSVFESVVVAVWICGCRCRCLCCSRCTDYQRLETLSAREISRGWNYSYILLRTAVPGIYFIKSWKTSAVIPMTMETRCSKVIFLNYPKKKPAVRYARTAAMENTGKKKVCFSRIICSRCCTRRNLRFHVENCQHANQKQLTWR